MAPDKARQGFVDRLYSSPVYRVGTLLGLAVALITAPLALPPVQDALFKDVELTIHVERETPAINVNQSFPELSVFYRGRNLTAENVSLAVTRVRITNSGDVGITDANISRTDPLGLRIGNGRIVGVFNAQASSSHLLRLATPQTRHNEVKLPTNIIMDPRDYVQFDVVLLKRSGDRLSFEPLGKVQGLHEIIIDQHDPSSQTEPFIWRALGGGADIQITRLIAYFVFGLIVIVFVVSIVVQFGEIKSRMRRRRRKKLAARVRTLLSDADAELWAIVSNLYVRNGISGLKSLERHLNRREGPPSGRHLRAAPHIDPPTAPPRKGESKPRYINKALDRSLGEWAIGDYIMEVAATVDVDLTKTSTRESTLDLIQKFERRVEEVAAESGIRPEALEKAAQDFSQELVQEVAYEQMIKETAHRRPSNDQRDKT
ncbi:MAG TPA: hypothetical protein VF552_05530 [Allosphingosinicella sp.]